MKTKLILIALSHMLFPIAQLVAQQSEQRNVGPYEGIHVAGSYDVKLIAGNEGTLQLKGDAGDLEMIETKVKNGTLIIQQKKQSWYKSWNSGKVYITVPVEQIDHVNLSGSGDIAATFPLEADEFEVILSGSGDIVLGTAVQTLEATVTGSGEIQLKGTALDEDYTLTGSGDINAQALKADIGSAKITGSGDISMYAKTKVNITVTGSGDVVCYGNPKQQKSKVTGSGDIRIRD